MSPQLHSIIPKLPATDLAATKLFYDEKLNFRQVGGDYPDYLMLFRDHVEIHFFLHCELDVLQNYGMCYIRVSDIETLYNDLKGKDIRFPDSGKLEEKPWRQKEFAIIDNNHNLLTFGEGFREQPMLDARCLDAGGSALLSNTQILFMVRS